MANLGKVGVSTSKTKNAAGALSIINPHAAGIDVGDRIHAVAVPPGSAAEPVRIFGTMTCDHKAISDWLAECGVTTVAMESTGVYWKPLHGHLLDAGFQVYLVNARNVKNVTGRKTDESDAAWLQKLHGCGLLASSYLPEDGQEAVRTLVRFRRTLMEDRSRSVLRMQKSLELMNVKLHTVISDLTGRTGMAIVTAILEGERNPEALLRLADSRIRTDEDTLRKSLEGTWRQEHLFTLGQSFKTYMHLKTQLEECDCQIEEHLRRYEARRNDGVVAVTDGGGEGPALKRKQKNAPTFNVRDYLRNILGIDVLAIPGIGDTAALQILAETGTDMGKWPTEKHFASWLNLCPNNKVSGGRLISSKVPKGRTSVAGQAFRGAANSLQRTKNWLGDYFRRMKAKGGNKYAIVATANKMARIYYIMVRDKTEFVPTKGEGYQKRRNERLKRYYQRKLEELDTTESQ